MSIKVWGFIGGIMAIAAVAGVFEALASPRRRNETEEKKEERTEQSNLSSAVL